MEIGVDAACLAINDDRLKVGVYQVVFNLLRELGRLDSRNQYLLYSFSPISASVMTQLGSKMTNVVVRPARGWNYLALPLALARRRPRFFLGPSQSLPLFCPCPTMVIVHDLAFERFPQFYPRSFRQLQRVTRLATRKAEKIITVSQSTKKDLIRFYRVPAKKIVVIPEGYDSQVFKPVSSQNPAAYLLFVGALKPIKNIPGLLRGFKYFADHSPRRFKLVLAGGDLWLDPEIRPTLQKLKLTEQVKVLGHVPTAELVALYRQATAFVSPSFYEGFGLTFLEAMACGCPVIGSAAGSIPEVVGKAGLLIDPDNAAQLGQAMLKIAGEAALRRHLAAAGLVRVRHFSWANFAQEVSRCARIGLQ